MAAAGVPAHGLFVDGRGVRRARDDSDSGGRARLRPVNAYGESKLAFERALPWYRRAHGLRHVSLRYFNACGATGAAASGTSPKRTSFRSCSTSRSAGGTPFTCSAPTTTRPTARCIRDYVHVRDIAEAHVRVPRRIRRRSATAFNLGNGTGYSNRQVIARRAAGDRAAHRGRRRAAPPRRPGAAGGQRRAHRPRARLAAGDPRPWRDDRERLAPGAESSASANGVAMIISRTPLRVSLVGGGTDLAAFYRRRAGRGRQHGDPQVHLHHRQPQVRLAASAPATRSPKSSTRWTRSSTS